MTPAQVTEIILACATLVSAVSALVVGVMNSLKIENVHLSINSRMDQLLASSALVAHSEGREEARKEAQESAEPPH